MGNTQSGGGFWKNRKKKKFLKDIKKTSKKDINVVSAIDSIATKFILQSNFQDMLKLQDKSYCDKLTILTKKIIEKQLSPREILYLDFRTKKGQTVNLLTREHFSFIDGNKLPTFDINSKVKKERIKAVVGDASPKNSLGNTRPAAAPYKKKSYHSMLVPASDVKATFLILDSF